MSFWTHRRISDLIGHLGYIILFMGITLIAFKAPVGWLFYATGQVLWVWVGFRTRLTSIWVWGMIFLINALWGLWNWSVP